MTYLRAAGFSGGGGDAFSMGGQSFSFGGGDPFAGMGSFGGVLLPVRKLAVMVCVCVCMCVCVCVCVCV